jgi:hypothetical protein
MIPVAAFTEALNEKKRLPELESIILQDVCCAYYYAKDMVKGKWEEGEAVITTNAYYSYHYAKDVLKWKIKGNKVFYISLIPILWNKFPKNIKSCPDIMTAYFKEVILK